MGQKPNWTAEEKAYLEKAWGNTSMQQMCRTLGRSENAVKLMVKRLGLMAASLSSDKYITLNQCIVALYGGRASGSAYQPELFERRGLKIYMRPMPKMKMRCVKMDEFWEWLRINSDLFDVSRLERGELGPEPEWLQELRRIHERKNTLMKPNETKWQPYEDSRLRHLAARGTLTVQEIARDMGRSEGAVVRRISTLGIERKTVRNKAKAWTQDELDTVADMIKRGHNSTTISAAIGRSAKSIHGVLYQRLGTEKISKVRAMLLDGAELKETRRYG